ncbi:farnesyl diphosphate synthase [Methylohalomonas lacus]|uniref:Farnesyl diphosphate synthase n=1 Tax=Methylohalomonas lacus TaxID=398773 RepID=A0AAE3HLP4_9GAMM|nr:farnesyl diphosphate synthase [Methylohalomonas lacus]MCS3902728.1 farnesyl diphosphate synthase [Methylohalomonas lacus]
MAFETRLQLYQRSAEAALERWLPDATIQPQHLHGAMRYAVLGNGKRIRPVLVYATGEAFGVDLAALDGPACAVEMIHAYSLVHDDLPAMDNDDLRRGQPTCHRAYDEATAILAGDALQALSFHILASDDAIQVAADRRLAMINALAVASGSRGMAGGQAIDLAAVGNQLNIAELENMHIHKTGGLIRASVELGALSSPTAASDEVDRVCHYAHCVGLAFQVRDDILDIESDTETLGKTQGADVARNKPTYPHLLGMGRAKQAAADLYQEALDSLAGFGPQADMLRGVANYIVNRNK